MGWGEGWGEGFGLRSQECLLGCEQGTSLRAVPACMHLPWLIPPLNLSCISPLLPHSFAINPVPTTHPTPCPTAGHGGCAAGARGRAADGAEH